MEPLRSWSGFCARAYPTTSIGVLASSLFLSACSWLHAADARDANAEQDDVLAKRAMLLADTEGPVLFLTSKPDAPAFGFGNTDAKLVVRPDPIENGRIPVRILGALHVEGYVPDGSVELYVQKTSLHAGAVVLRAGDRVGVIGPKNDALEHEVAIRVPVGNVVLGPYKGRLSADLLSAKRPDVPDVLTGGIAYQLPAGQVLPIYNGFQGELVTLVPPRKTSMTVTVTGSEGGWFRVRVGSGPCIEGFTNAQLQLLGQNALPVPAAKPPRTRASRGQVPWRIAQTRVPCCW